MLANALRIPVYKLFVFADSDNNKEALDLSLNSATKKEINAIVDIVKTVLAIK